MCDILIPRDINVLKIYLVNASEAATGGALSKKYFYKFRKITGKHLRQSLF